MLVLVGANGFLGRHMCEALEKRGAHTTVISTNPDRDFFGRFAPSLRVMTAAEADSAAGEDLISTAKAVVYFRWCPLPATVASEPWHELSENVAPAMRLFLRVARASQDAKIVFLSSGGTVYGTGTKPHTESAPTRPISSHGLGKLMGEESLSFIGRLADKPYTILRVSNAVGRWQTNRAQGIVGVALRRTRDGRPVQLFGDGHQVRDFVDADDVAEAIYLASTDTKHRAAVWNVGSGKGIAICDLLDHMSTLTGQEIHTERVAPRETDVPYNVLDCRKIAEELGWKAHTPIDQSILSVWQAIQTS